YDVYSSVIQSGCQKASYIVQFLWCDLTSGYDMIGPYFPVPNSMDVNTLQQFFMSCLKSFHAYGFRVSIVLCDGASSNLTLLKMLCGYPRAVLPMNDAAEDLRASETLTISATQGLSKEPTQESAKRAASFLEACNLLLKKDF
ncbi:unnamed protein product, partial [Porites evermanni]